MPALQHHSLPDLELLEPSQSLVPTPTPTPTLARSLLLAALVSALIGVSAVLPAQSTQSFPQPSTQPSTQTTRLSPPIQRPGAEFEGTVTMRIASSSGFDEVTYSTRNGWARMDVVNGADTAFTLRHGDRLLTVDRAKQRYFEQSMADVAAGRTVGTGSRLEVAATGRKEIIAGYECEHVIVTTDSVNDDICLARGIGTFLLAVGPAADSRAAPSAPPELRDLLAHGFPLRDQRVGGDLVLEVTKIDRKPLTDGMFRVPSGYAKLVLRTVTEAPRA